MEQYWSKFKHQHRRAQRGADIYATRINSASYPSNIREAPMQTNSSKTRLKSATTEAIIRAKEMIINFSQLCLHGLIIWVGNNQQNISLVDTATWFNKYSVLNQYAQKECGKISKLGQSGRLPTIFQIIQESTLRRWIWAMQNFA